MGIPTAQEDIHTIAANAWDELAIPSGSSVDRIVSVYREICLKRALGMEVDKEFFKKAVAYRFLNSIPLARKEYRADDILPLLHSLDAQGDITDPSRSVRACAMLDVSIGCMERAQSPWHLPHVNYVINVHYCMRKHVVRRRYTEFQALHNALMQKLPVIPHLPEKSWRYKLIMPSDRARDLVLYLSRVIQLLTYRRLFSTDIMAFLDINFCKVRSEEEALSADALNRIAPVLEGSIVFLVGSSWMSQWRNFVLDKDGMSPPGPISNEDLLDEHGMPKKHMVAPRHYRFLSAPAWKFFWLIYRGGPEITRNTKTIYAPTVLSPDMACLKIQTYVRGFLARSQARRRRRSLGLRRPIMERSYEAMETLHRTEQKMQNIQSLLQLKVTQNRHSAAVTIQQAYKRYKHRVLYADDIPVKIETTVVPEVEVDYFTLQEIGLIDDDETRLVQFIHTMQKGVAILKLSSRYKPTPKLKFFKLDRIGSQLMWTCKAKPTPKSIVLAHVQRIAIEAPVALKSVLGLRPKQVQRRRRKLLTRRNMHRRRCWTMELS
ncbi:hypothetical protein, variant 1 [Aphanomyces invadans]|uniref:DUSP domain-containing protein n=1 Tax=Aphanomyces invadans TaxID=157072 RepID=A0A024UAP5_9STRA|nr:hypothetical protein, variant 1 [Aphanomyces invadans]ETW03339.1 hypothetical protein, variant 1 [Aphanomyces invadans]|eukprot:XP_008867568.1 hypothetical protein, variant 1 [Aphanomyces invadans]